MKSAFCDDIIHSAWQVPHVRVGEIWRYPRDFPARLPATVDPELRHDALKYARRNDVAAEVSARNGTICGHPGRPAALDVFPIEPLPAENPYISYENVTLTAHAACMTDDAYVQLWIRAHKVWESLDQV